MYDTKRKIVDCLAYSAVFSCILALYLDFTGKKSIIFICFTSLVLMGIVLVLIHDVYIEFRDRNNLRKGSFEYKFNKIKNNKNISLIDRKIKLYDLLLANHYMSYNIIYKYVSNSKYNIIYKPFIEVCYIGGKEVKFNRGMPMIVFDINVDFDLIVDTIFDASMYPYINLKDIIYSIWPCFDQMEN